MEELATLKEQIGDLEMMTSNKKVEKLQEDMDSANDMGEMERQKMEEARKAYIVAVVVSKEKQDEESIAATANARLHLQSVAAVTWKTNIIVVIVTRRAVVAATNVIVTAAAL
ncbi:hypothetical protein RYX36_026165 [Vicia faba]